MVLLWLQNSFRSFFKKCLHNSFILCKTPDADVFSSEILIKRMLYISVRQTDLYFIPSIYILSDFFEFLFFELIKTFGNREEFETKFSKN